MDVDISDLHSTIAFAKRFASTLKKGDVVAFFGDLGSGKTTLISYIVQFLGLKATVSSPTFNYLNIYKGDSFAIHHFDLYRLKQSEFLAMGLDEFLFCSEIVLIEWPYVIADILPKNVHTLYLNLKGEKRTLLLNQEALL